MWNATPNWGPTSSYVEPVAIPDAHPGEEPRVCVSINKSWLPYVLGSLMQLTQPTTWDTSDPSALQLVLTDATELIESIGTAGGCDVIEFRFTDDCVLQYSTDGGTTWLDTPGWGTFSSSCFTGPTGPEGPTGPAGPSAPSVPPNPSGADTADEACNIAAYLAALVIKAAVQQQVDAINASATIIDAVLGLISLIPGLDIVASLGIAAAYALNTAIQAAGTSAFTTALSDATLWSDVQCCIYENINSVGYVDDTNYDDVETCLSSISYVDGDVTAAIAAYWTQLTLTGVQSVQLSGSLYVGDCSSCGAWCFEWDFTVAEGDWALRFSPGVQGTWVSGTGYVASVDGGNLSAWIRLTHTAFPVYECAVTYLRTVTDPGHISFIHIDLSGSDIHIDTGWDAASASPQAEVFGFTETPCDLVDVRVGAAGTSGTVVIQSIILKGPGANPFGVTNCPA